MHPEGHCQLLPLGGEIIGFIPCKCTRSAVKKQTLYVFILLSLDLLGVMILGCTRCVVLLQTLYATAGRQNAARQHCAPLCEAGLLAEQRRGSGGARP